MAKALVASVVAILVLLACGSFQGFGSSSSLPRPSPPTAALAKWKDFPVQANPRPLIVFGVSNERIAPNGFASEPDRKVDWGCNKFALAGGVEPSTAAPAPVMLGGVSYPAITSARAWSELMIARKPTEVPPGCTASRPFVVKGIRLGAAGFFTDRGQVKMPAWIFEMSEFEASLTYAAIDPAAFWSGGLAEEGRGAGVTNDGRTLKVGVSDAGRGPCGSDYTASVAESSTAVAVAVKRFPHASDDTVACDLMIRTSFIDVELKAPLGNRVLVDEEGHVGAACFAAEVCVVGPEDL